VCCLVFTIDLGHCNELCVGLYNRLIVFAVVTRKPS